MRGAEESGGPKRLYARRLAGGFAERLADVEVRRQIRMARPQRAGDDRADARHGHRGRGHVTRVPDVLVARMRDLFDDGNGVRADDRPLVHHGGDFFEPLAELDVIDRAPNGGEGRKDRFDSRPGENGS